MSGSSGLACIDGDFCVGCGESGANFVEQGVTGDEFFCPRCRRACVVCDALENRAGDPLVHCPVAGCSMAWHTGCGTKECPENHQTKIHRASPHRTASCPNCERRPPLKPCKYCSVCCRTVFDAGGSESCKAHGRCMPASLLQEVRERLRQVSLHRHGDQILSKVAAADRWNLFARPVDVATFPTYREVVQEPTDLGEIRQWWAGPAQRSDGDMVELERRLRLMLDNSYRFNGKDHEQAVVVATEEVDAVFREGFRKLKADLEGKLEALGPARRAARRSEYLIVHKQKSGAASCPGCARAQDAFRFSLGLTRALADWVARETGLPRGQKEAFAIELRQCLTAPGDEGFRLARYFEDHGGVAAARAEPDGEDGLFTRLLMSMRAGVAPIAGGGSVEPPVEPSVEPSVEPGPKPEVQGGSRKEKKKKRKRLVEEDVHKEEEESVRSEEDDMSLAEVARTMRRNGSSTPAVNAVKSSRSVRPAALLPQADELPPIKLKLARRREHSPEINEVESSAARQPPPHAPVDFAPPSVAPLNVAPPSKFAPPSATPCMPSPPGSDSAHEGGGGSAPPSRAGTPLTFAEKIRLKRAQNKALPQM